MATRLYDQSLSERQHLWLQIGLFQIAWLLCVLGGSLVALPVTLTVVCLQLWLAEQRRLYVHYLAVVTLIGFVCDLMLVNIGVLQLGSGLQLQPLWLLCLWPLFATTVPHALRMFHHRPAISALGGGALAPLSYFGGSRLAGVELMSPTWLALVIIAAAWALVFPLLISLYCRRFS